MSELIKNGYECEGIRRKLLAGVSALALTTYIASTTLVEAQDHDRPNVWIELGGQLSRLQDGEETFSPSLMTERPSIFSPSSKFEKSPLFAFDGTGKISFQADNSDWIFSASVRYGRSSAKKNVHQQTYPKEFNITYSAHGIRRSFAYPPYAAKFADTGSQRSEQHVILDFQVGKDVGLGLFGSRGGTSILNFGIRFAQFTSKTNVALKSDPDWHFVYTYLPSLISSGYNTSRYPIQQPYHSHLASLRATRSFHGVGPAISWNASMPFAGNSQDGELTFDWGANAALLFGRQKAKTSHQTTAEYGYGYFVQKRITLYQHGPYSRTRSRSVTVPNIGGFAGVSFRYAAAKVSFGYRADIFFGAMDGGIDTRKTYDRDFYGPFATISIGLGG